MKFTVFASLLEDIDKSHVWVTENSGIEKRTLVCIQYKENKIYLDALKIDKGFVNFYNIRAGTKTISMEPTEHAHIVISDWYRRSLGIEKNQKNVDLKISKVKCCINIFYRRITIGICHPDLIIKQNTQLGILALSLALLSLTPMVKDFVGIIITLFRWLFNMC